MAGNAAALNGGCIAANLGATVQLQGTTLWRCAAGADASVPASGGGAGGSASPSCTSGGGSGAAGADEGITGTGGALWLGSGALANVSSSVVRFCSAAVAGGACAITAGATLVVSASLLGNNTAGGGGGALAVYGAAAVTMANSSVVANAAQMGGFVGFFGGGERSATLALSAMYLGNNQANAGSLYAVADSSNPFEVRVSARPLRPCLR